MAKQANEGKTVENNTAKRPAGSKKTAKEIVKRHLKDKNDVITEEDMKSVEIVTGLGGEEPLDIPNDINRPKDEDKDNQYTTPWDTISE